MLRTPVTIIFEIINSSKMTLYYSWDLGMTSEIISRNMYTIAMPQAQNHVLSESHSSCSLIVTALQKTVIKNHPILFKVPFLFRYQYYICFMKEENKNFINFIIFAFFSNSDF